MINFDDLRLIMEEIDEKLDDAALRQMISSTGSINGKVNYEQFSSVLNGATSDVESYTNKFITENTNS